MHQLDIDVALRHSDDGFTVRLRHLREAGGWRRRSRRRIVT
jgi:hypothetical protein